MRELRRAAHTVYSLHYHFVFTTKYRKPVLVGEIGHSLRDLIREICRSEDIEILEGHVRSDDVHLLLSAPLCSANIPSGPSIGARQVFRRGREG
jgi:putative transposase